MKILALIPARGGSKGIPGKNIKMLGGKPLLQYTFQAAKESKLLNRIMLSSDSPEICKVASFLGLEVPFLRPSELGKDETGSMEVLLHAINFMKTKGFVFDAVCLLEPTSPFRNKNFIDLAIQTFMNGEYDSLISVRQVPSEYNPHWVFEERGGLLSISTGDRQMIKRRQDLPKAYHRDGAIYLTKTDVLLKQNSIYGNRIGYIDNTSSPHINLDELSDWTKAEQLLQKNN